MCIDCKWAVMVKRFMGWWSKVWWDLTCYHRGVWVSLLFPGALPWWDSLSLLPFLQYPLLHWPPLALLGSVELIQPRASIFPHLAHPVVCYRKKKRKKPQSSFMLPFTSMQIIHYLLQSQCVLISLFAILAVCIVLRIWDENGASLYFPIYLTFFHKNT